jgi:hypothetical protein
MQKITKEIYMYVLGAVVVLGIFFLVGVLMFIEMPSSNKDLLNIVIGALIGAFLSVVGYFFGSSKGSADKTDLLNKALETPKPVDPAKPE